MRGRLAVLAVAMCITSVVAAQSSEADSARRRGVELAQQQRWEEAAAAFHASLDAEPRPESACNLGLTYERWGGHVQAAIDAYQRCAELDRDGRFRDHALERSAALRPQLAQEQQSPFVADPPAPIEASDPVVQAQPTPVAPMVPVVTGPRHQRTWALFWGGVASTVVGGALLAGGAVAAGNAREDEDILYTLYPNRLIDSTDTESLQRYADANRGRKVALGLYLGGGALVGLGVTLMLVDLIRGDGEDDDAPALAVQPIRGGATVSGTFSF